jgi:hypothetical protein
VVRSLLAVKGWGFMSDSDLDGKGSAEAMPSSDVHGRWLSSLA